MARTKTLPERVETGAADVAGKAAARTGARPAEEKFSQDTALFKLLGQALAPYWRFTALALVLMLASAATNVVPPYLLQQAIDGPIRQGNVNALWRITLLYGITAVAS